LRMIPFVHSVSPAKQSGHALQPGPAFHGSVGASFES
jgi:hypothetical protein